jgi:rubrerythrin
MFRGRPFLKRPSLPFREKETMSILFNPDEIFALAVQIERNGAKFYFRAAEYAFSPPIREFFKSLAILEQTHERTFTQMKEELPEEDRSPSTFDPDGQGGDYLKALADGRIFDVKSDPLKKLTGKESLNDILSLAIGMEKDSIIFYLGMRELVPEGPGQNKIDAIIKEEMRHIAFLSKELTSI